MSVHKSQKRSAHVTCSYARVRARIMLKIGMMSTTYVRKLCFKFEKNPFSGSREEEVNERLAVTGVIHCIHYRKTFN